MLLQAWSSFRSEVVEEVADALHSLEINIPHGSSLPKFVQHIVSKSDFEQVLVRVRNNVSHQLDENELRLLVMLGMSAIPIPDDDYHNLCQEQSDKIVVLTKYIPEVWKDTLQSLETLPAESAAWDQVESLIAEVRKLAVLKISQRDVQRRLLQEAIERLQSREDLSYFEAEYVLSWSTEHIDEAVAGPLAQEVNQLLEDMAAYLALKEEQPETIGERRQLKAREDALEQNIVSHRDHLNALLSPLPDGQTPPEETIEAHLTDQELIEDASKLIDETVPAHEAPDLETDTVSWTVTEEPVASTPYGQQEFEEPLEGVGPTSVEETAPALGELLDDPSGPVRDTVVHEQPEIEVFDEPKAELRPLTNAAQMWRLEGTADAAKAFFWATLAHGDWSGAYWLARAIQSRFAETPLDPELLAVVVGAPLVTTDSAQMAQDMATRIHQYDSEALGWPGSLLALGAALRGTLVAPEAGFAPWLERPSAIPSLYEIVNAVREFSNYRIVLRPSLLHGVASEDERRSRIAEAARRMEDYMKRAPRQTMSYQPATAIWREMVARKNPLYELMQLVSENKANNTQRVSQILNEWGDKDFIEHQIDSIRGRKQPRIVASARQEIIRSVQEICGLARSWQQLTEQEERIAREGKWLFQQVATLRTRVQNSISSVGLELKELSGPEAAAAPRACVLAFTQQLCDFLRTLELPTDAFECQSAPPWYRFVPHSSAESDLRAVLIQRLYWLPELTPERVYSGVDAPELPQVIDALSQAWADERDTHETLELWLKKEDFRYVEYLLEALPEQDRESAQREYQETRNDARERLAQQVEQLREEIEQAVVDGLIADDMRAEYLGQLDSMAPYDTDEFPSKYARLAEIRADIENARQYRLDALARTWDDERKQQLSLVGPDRWTYVEQRVHEAFERRDSRAIEEYLDHISGVGQMDKQQFQDIFSDTTATHDLLEEFLQKLDTIERELGHNGEGLRTLERAIKDGTRFAEYNLSNLSKPRQREVFSALEAWQRLKGTDGRIGDGQLFQSLAILLNFLQYQLDSLTASYPFNIMQRKNDSILVQSQMTVSEALVRPVPQFGSMSGGQFDVLCVWERPSADTLSALLYDLRSESRSTIVLYFGRITRQRRKQIARDRDKHLPVVILDETLLAFVALKSMAQNPLPVFLKCALPYTGISPYTPGQAGNVPPEIFFGREEMVRQLQGLETCIVFGGRQLGKSALLRNVQARFHNPKSEQYAWVKDIKNVGNPAHRLKTDTLWPMLRDGFKEMGLWGRARAEREDDIVNHIRQVVLENPSRRVIVLLDEADNFLETDASENFRIVDRLRVLMVDTQRRFKVVFAGLHNVQRFKNVPNQPLAHFGKALCVGPLEPTEALKLVRQPLEVMGFHIDNSTALRILSHTNYHPGLIQLFCDELLKWLYRNPRVQIPYEIKREDVDAVYLRQNVRDGIRQRFEWTLALDPRYQVVACSLIEDQTRDRDSYSRQYTSSEILGIARNWWQEGFEQVEIKSLLDEMVGLGVLIESSEGLYRLRSPNLVRLMGEANVEQALLQVADLLPPQRRLDPDHHHALLNVQQDLYSPLTIAQEHLLNKDNTGVGLLFSSTIAGSKRIDDVLRYFLPVGIPESEGACQELRLRLHDGTQLVDEIQRVAKQHPTAKHLILSYRFQADMGEQQLIDQVEKAAEFLKRDEVQLKHRIRLICLLDSRAAWTWMQIDPQDREALEQWVDAVVSMAPWSKPGVRQWMEHREMITTEDTLRHVYDASGGWHSLLEDLFKACGSKSGVDPRDQAVKLTEQFGEANFRQAIWDRLDLKGLPVAEVILRFLCQENGPENAGVSADLVSPQLVDEPLVSSDDDCRRALALLERLRYISLDTDEDQLIRVNPVILRTAL